MSTAITALIPTIRALILDDDEDVNLRENSDARITQWVRNAVNLADIPGGFAIDSAGAGSNIEPDCPPGSAAAAIICLHAALTPFGVAEGSFRTRAISYNLPASERRRAEQFLRSKLAEALDRYADASGNLATLSYAEDLASWAHTELRAAVSHREIEGESLKAAADTIAP